MPFEDKSFVNTYFVVFILTKSHIIYSMIILFLGKGGMNFNTSTPSLLRGADQYSSNKWDFFQNFSTVLLQAVF